MLGAAATQDTVRLVRRGVNKLLMAVAGENRARPPSSRRGSSSTTASRARSRSGSALAAEGTRPPPLKARPPPAATTRSPKRTPPRCSSSRVFQRSSRTRWTATPWVSCGCVKGALRGGSPPAPVRGAAGGHHRLQGAGGCVQRMRPAQSATPDGPLVLPRVRGPGPPQEQRGGHAGDDGPRPPAGGFVNGEDTRAAGRSTRWRTRA